jgi:hypothetical protein
MIAAAMMLFLALDAYISRLPLPAVPLGYLELLNI